MIDFVLLAVIGISTLLGLMRGFVAIVISTLSWLLAGWAALMFGNDAAHWWSAPAAPGTAHLIAGYVSIFLAVVIAVWALGLVVRTAVRSTSLNGADRALGAGLGVARGALLGCGLLLLGSFTPLPREATWRDSHLRPVLDPGVRWMQARMPNMPELPQMPAMGLPEVNMAQLPTMELGKPALSGDNGVLGALVAGRGWPRPVEEEQVSDPADVSARGSDASLPENIDPALVRPDPTDPARSGSPGQARPPSQ